MQNATGNYQSVDQALKEKTKFDTPKPVGFATVSNDQTPAMDDSLVKSAGD